MADWSQPNTTIAAAVVIKCESLNKKKKKFSIISYPCSKAFGTRYALF